jgi:SAM-dependent methyltransferase
VILASCPEASYTGVDIESSPEVDGREASGAWFHSYDGENLPFADGSFDLVYSRQVFEHIRYPDRVAAEIFRVLRPGGLFIGSVSGLEPYHSFSVFNFTPYGLYRVLQDNSLRLIELRPGAESTSLFVRQLTVRRILNFRLIYPLVDIAARMKGWSARQANYIKLRFAGHMSFVARKPS